MAKLTPMLAQYMSLKKRYKDAILLFRMGDFYEMFFEDAVTASEILGLTLTARNHDSKEQVPLAGVPHHAVETYLARLIKAGKKVAICEQLEDPRKAKGLVKRDVVEVVTAGTTLSESLLEGKANNFLLGIAFDDERYGLAVADLSTGEFRTAEISKAKFWEEIERIGPSEVVVPENWPQQEELSFKERFPTIAISRTSDWIFEYNTAYEALKEHFDVTSLKGFGCDDLTLGISAAGAVLHYLEENQKKNLTHLNRLSQYYSHEYMVLDASVQRNLEIATSLSSGTKEGTLLSVVDRTQTSMGGRLLRNWLLQPLRNIGEINRRLDSVEEMVKGVRTRDEIRDILKGIGDVERLVARICCARANGRDLFALKNSLKLLPSLRNSLESTSSDLLKEIAGKLFDFSEITDLIDKAIIENPPLSINDGDIIKDHFNAELDELRKIRSGGKNWIAQLQTKERQKTGITSLKVGYNQVFGYYIEVTQANAAKVPDDYIRKQTLVNNERYITPELKGYEEKILGAEEKIVELEKELFFEVRDRVAQHAQAIQEAARAVAQLDVLASLADLAVERDYIRPQVTEGDSIEIKDGRHPVVEYIIPEGTFVPNDTKMDNSRNQVLIITGPNMSGKSTYLRQVALITLLAQIGSFVPAKSAKIGVVDRIFTRVGASDNLARGESTFLVEMNEAANILNNSTPKSLILLDEVGRGTSTFDGLSIAWAVVEYIHNSPRIRAKTLFATHYHELTELELILPRVINYNVAVQEQDGRVVFLRKIVKGGCDHSYGIEVARLAGLPQEVIERAKEVLANLEENELTPTKLPKKARRRSSSISDTMQLNLFESVEHPVMEEIKKLDISSLTPLEALNIIDRWKKQVSQK